MTIESSEHAQHAFTHIHAQELLEIKKRREKQSYDTTEIDPAQPDLVGLALSGGGIRSATFCLGFLQELHRLRLLRIFDYLSTVSGGGYLGGWWSAWLSRHLKDPDEPPRFGPEDIHDPVNLLKRSLESSDPVAQEFQRHLRSSTRGEKLLSVVGRTDLQQLTMRLYEPLEEELNAYVDKGKTPDKKWERKLSLLDTFPCELRDIFPPREQIEPEREDPADDTSQKESEGSRCAWKDPIHHLRLFANYLTPRKGILSADTWRAISVISRNLILTWLILLPLLGAVMLLGQAYFFLNPATQQAFACTENCTDWTKQLPVLIALVKPLVILLTATAIIAVAWLLCNRDNSSSLDWIIQLACLLALAALLTAAVFAIPAVHTGINNYLQLPDSLNFLIPLPGTESKDYAASVRRLRLLVGALFTVLIVIGLMWRWGLQDGKFADVEATSEARSAWRREVRRGRFSRAQSKLLVTTAVVAVVLLLSWVSCLFTREGQLNWGIKIPVALIPVLSAVGGSIFTAMRSTPMPTEDHQAPKPPSRASRFVFAATPPLVVIVLAVAASAGVHQLLITLSRPDLEYQKSIYAFVSVAAVLAIALCMALAIFELEKFDWSTMRKRRIPWAMSIGLVMLIVSWGVQAFLNYWNTNPNTFVRNLLITSVAFAVLITAVVLGKLIIEGRKDQKNKNVSTVWSFGKGFGTAALLFISLTGVGSVIGLLIYFNTTNGADIQWVVGKISRAFVLTLLAFAGGLILFRILVNRMKTDEGKNQLKIRVLGKNRFAKRAESLWLTAAVCLTLPIVMIGASHYLGGQEAPQAVGMSALTLFPFSIGSLLIVMMGLRALVIQRQLHLKEPVDPWYVGIFKWIGHRMPGFSKDRPVEETSVSDQNRPVEETSKPDQKRRRAYQVAALGSICLVALVDTIIRSIADGQLVATLGIGPANARIMAAAIFVSLPVFGISVFEIPVDNSTYEKFKNPPPGWLCSQAFLWFLAAACIGLAFWAGLLLPNWLFHVAHIPMGDRVTPILLPVAAACFLIVLFEFYWGEKDNLRSLLLAGFAYLAVAVIFFLKVSNDPSGWNLVLGLLAAICVWVGALGWMVDPNAVSMHQFYKGRLVRAYLGASNLFRYKSGDKEITETVAGDDLLLKSLINCDRGGPYHLINTTLNLSAGRDLATAQRSASSFVLSQKYCGSNRTKYCLTDKYMNGQMTLGTAVAASGAAVSPSMGAKKPTSALAMLMTLLNVRLGYWAPTPHRTGWNSSQPRLWPFYLVREFLSQTNDLSDYCYLTDGGHFDNTGLYSLIERGCRFIVLLDCGADPKPARFEDLGEAIRRCRIDFGTEINLKLEPLLKSQATGAASCFVVGKIKFSEKHLRTLALAGKGEGYGRERDEWKQQGIIVYVKPSVVANATADVRGYGLENKFFPQQPTTNQWFGEAQFESYRRLGQTCAHIAFGHIKSIGLENQGRISLKKIQATFFDLYKRPHK